MAHEITALVAQYYLLLAALLMAAFAGMAVERFFSKMRRERWREKNRWRWEQLKPAKVAPKQIDAADQLRIVMNANFTIQPLLNKGEARVFKELDRFVISCNPGWQVMAQVSLGKFCAARTRTPTGA